MDLLRCVRRSNWTGEDVQSYETEHALMEGSIFCNETGPFMTPCRPEMPVSR